MDDADIAVATITWARSAAEEETLARSLSRLSDTGWPVAVADRTASLAFRNRLRRLPGFHAMSVSEPGLVAQIRTSVELAATFERRFTLYSEPDKEFFFGTPVREFVRAAPDEPSVGIVLASRSPESFDTFPPMQRYTEGIINHLTGEEIGCSGDYSYGPFLMNRALLPDVATLEPRLGWGWRHRIFLAARRRGLRVLHVTGYHPCPPGERIEDDAERTHRLRQLSENIQGLVGCGSVR